MDSIRILKLTGFIFLFILAHAVQAQTPASPPLPDIAN